MVQIIEKNILTNKDGIICHQVNCFKIGKGLAKYIINMYPIVKFEYDKTVKQYNNDKNILLGETLYVPITEGLTIANLFSQYNYGNDGELYTYYNFLTKCLEDVKFRARLMNKDIHIPYMIGCGLGGGKWDYVYDIINNIFKDNSSINCFINKK